MQDATVERVVGIVRESALEVGGDRAARSAAPVASLERDLGLGSLERVELLSRLEASFGRPLHDGALQLDTPTDLARAVAAAGGTPLPAEHRRDLAMPAALGRGARLGTIHEALYLHARAEPERPSVYLREDDGTTSTIRYGQLWGDASAVAGGLRGLGVARGDTRRPHASDRRRLPGGLPGHPRRGSRAGAHLSPCASIASRNTRSANPAS